MAPTLATLAQGRDNHCNLLRFVAATLVLFGHCYPIANDSIDPLMKATWLDIPRIAVDVFFVLSGFLVSGSLFARQQVSSFCLSRLLRIFPALVVSVLLTVLGFFSYSRWLTAPLQAPGFLPAVPPNRTGSTSTRP